MELKIIDSPPTQQGPDREFYTIAQLKHDRVWPYEFLPAYGMYPYLKRAGEDLLGIEIGVLKGENISLLLDLCPNIKRIYGIDPYLEHTDNGFHRSHEAMKRYEKIARENLNGYRDRVSIFEKSSNDAVSEFEEGSLDFVLLDGDHSYDGIMQDLINYSPKIKKNGYIFVHDCHLECVRNAMHDFRNKQKLRTPILISKNYVQFWQKEVLVNATPH